MLHSVYCLKGCDRVKTHSRTLYGPNIQANYPVENSKHIPGLIHHCQKSPQPHPLSLCKCETNMFYLVCSVSVLPATIALPNSLARHIQSTWMRSAMTDPCLFHATLFSASAHMDGLQGIHNNPLTIFHQLQALKLLRGRLRRPDFRPNYGIIATVLALQFFNVLYHSSRFIIARNIANIMIDGH
jgi:hypothetical protein